jgi:hypothetical protein
VESLVGRVGVEVRRIGGTVIRGAESGVCAGPRRVVEYNTTIVSRLRDALLPAAAATSDTLGAHGL